MSRRLRRSDSPAFKARVVLDAVKEEKTLIELAQTDDFHPNQVKQWSDQLLEAAAGIYGDTAKANRPPAINLQELHGRLLSWRVSVTMEAAFCIEACIEALQKAVTRFGKSDIFNTDEGCEFIRLYFTQVLIGAGAKIGMGGRGSWRGSIVVGRFCRAIKYEGRGICGPTRMWLRHWRGLTVTSASATPSTRICHLTGGHQTRPTLLRCHQWSRRHSRCGNPLKKPSPTVHSSRATSIRPVRSKKCRP